MMLHLKTM